MSTVAKTASIYAAPSVASARAVPGTQVATSVTSDPAVEAANPSVSVSASFANATSVYQDDNHRGRGGQGSQERLPQPVFRMVINATSQAFVALVENTATPEAAEGGGVYRRPKGFSGIVSKVIDMYETTARVISGSNVGGRGETITLTL
ncbi:MAG: hypothetical protein EXQ86_10905 [Rhodospirillales bacterium]|nr:hypothetical protein [Rhodospirillales bacterium]